MKIISQYITLCLLGLVAALSLSSCKDDDLSLSVPDNGIEAPDFGDVYALNFMVTVDDMGSGLSTRAGEDPLELRRRENYIDLERFRVLFFDNKDDFLFESKNRWVKQVEANNTFSAWYVSVPLGAYGNDSYGEGMEYDWNAIRNYLTHNEFKIAILANRPAQLLYPGFTESELELPDGVFDNDGPYWGPNDVGKKNIFDLHHFQYDIIYADKGKFSEGAASSYYDFIMSDIESGRPTMGAAINWVSFTPGDSEKIGSTEARNLLMPGENHPIPMYGIQRFSPIPEAAWKVGSPFDISNDPADSYPSPSVKYDHKAISLLRSCVRLDLKIPKSLKNKKPVFLALFYSNIYSRTEPMDTWSPTNDIWKPHDSGCEWESILNYGPVSWSSSSNYGQTKQLYQQRMSWFYGIWNKEKNWPFATRAGSTKVNLVAEGSTTPYPRIFNTCIQRNKAVWVLKNGDVSDLYNDDYYHYVVYTGERNINDPNTLPNMTKNPYISCFVISWDNSNYYAIPLLNYAKLNDSDYTNKVFGPHAYNPYSTGGWPTALDTYITSLISETNKNNWPYPLLRNHIYSFTITGPSQTKAGDESLSEAGIVSEVIRTPDINYSELVKRIDVGNMKPVSSSSPVSGIR